MFDEQKNKDVKKMDIMDLICFVLKPDFKVKSNLTNVVKKRLRAKPIKPLKSIRVVELKLRNRIIARKSGKVSC